YLFWYQAKKTRYIRNHTSFETARFRSTMTGGALLVQSLVNLLLLIVTLGLAWPWVLIRRTRFEFSCLTVEGPLDLAGIVQEPQLATATGDALSSLRGADVGCVGARDARRVHGFLPGRPQRDGPRGVDPPVGERARDLLR